MHDDSDEAFDMNDMREEDLAAAMAQAYENGELDEDDDAEDNEDGAPRKENDSDIDNIDFQNFKGIYFNDDPNRKYQDPETGCHFEYFDLCRRMAKLKE